MKRLLLVTVLLTFAGCGHVWRSILPHGIDCPYSHPIKGNDDSGIYHMPGDEYYETTVPEVCFKTEEIARAAGFRKAEI